ncbi:cupin domain-containing protein [Deinococcus yavapaiensis]|uniref:Cupin type-2 domain-containing protein n=1 Tax=Deinococcus yavapaiensis KR-236 TaxID=694435 RepID=A0A318SA99_9DEIO|nr:cupin domain-containing protein [Deinococcus yavapaiensis]PYE54990.1 hypothetical protein DES52_104264 [Deinococcus yavapaiensis KR-236]
MTDTTPPVRSALSPRTFRVRADRFRVLVSGGDTDERLSVLDVRARRGFELPVHVHDAEDEILTVLEGQVCVHLAGDDVLLGPFDTLLLRRGVPHALRLLTETARLTATYTPAGFERYLQAIAEAGPTVDESVESGIVEPPNVPALVRLGETFGLRYFPEPFPARDAQER